MNKDEDDCSFCQGTGIGATPDRCCPFCFGKGSRKDDEDEHWEDDEDENARKA